MGWILPLPGRENGGVHVAVRWSLTDLWSRVVSPWRLRPLLFSGALSARGRKRGRSSGGWKLALGAPAKIRRGGVSSPAVGMLQLAPSRAGSALIARQRELQPLPRKRQATGDIRVGTQYHRNNARNNVKLTCKKPPSKPSKSHRPLLLPPTGPLYSRPASPMKQGIKDWIVGARIIEPHGIMSITARYCSLFPTQLRL